jgi:hypothetical protein
MLSAWRHLLVPGLAPEHMPAGFEVPAEAPKSLNLLSTSIDQHAPHTVACLESQNEQLPPKSEGSRRNPRKYPDRSPADAGKQAIFGPLQRPNRPWTMKQERGADGGYTGRGGTHTNRDARGQR